MMGLQMLVGFSRYKEVLKGTAYEQREDGSKVYMQRYSTDTHTSNLKNFELLEELGLVEIEGIEDKGESLLILERLGFKNYRSLREIGKAILNRDNETLQKNKVIMKKVKFRLTDKPIDFEDMFAKINDLKPYKSQEEKRALRRYFGLFREKKGILGTKEIDIGKDRFGRDVIFYGKNPNFATRINEKFKEKKENKKFEDTIKIDKLTPEKQAEIVQEFRTKMQKREYSGKEVSL